MSTFEPVRIGVVGYGLGGRVFHVPLITSASDLSLVGVVTRDPDRRAQLTVDQPSVPAVDSLRALVDLGAEAVAISSATGSHTSLTDEALALGLHVVCDKPLALDAASAAASIDAAAAAGLLLTAYQNRRWDSDFLTLRRVLSSGAIGEVFRFESRFERWAPGPPRAWWRSELPASKGGGVRLDLGAHLVDQALQLFGPASSVYAESFVRRSGGLGDDDITMELAHAGGVTSYLAASTWSGDTSRRFRVQGREGAYVVGGVDGQEDALRSGLKPAGLGDAWGAEPASRWGHVVRGPESSVVPSERGRWDLFYPAFAAAVRGLGPLPVDPRDALATMQILDAAARSAESRQVVFVP